MKLTKNGGPWAWLERLLSPGLISCGRCHRPWRLNMSWVGVESHTTSYASELVFFALCEDCWQKLGTAEARLPYYSALWEEWGRPANQDWEDLRAAVYAEAGESTPAPLHPGIRTRLSDFASS